jgi:hypothetical protein
MKMETAEMDELEFRRKIYADPNCDDQRIKDAAAEDQKKQDFWNELKQLDNKMQQASKVSVPEDFAHKLILRQSIESHAKSKTRTRIHLALAASIAFVFGISFTMWQLQDQIDLGEHALAHIYHEGEHALGAQENISLQQVNAKLARYGGQLNESLGQVFYANFCDFEGVQSLHMVMQGAQDKVTIFIVPHQDGQKVNKRFSDAIMSGQSIDFRNASLVIVGENISDVNELSVELKTKMQFSA